MKPHCYLAQILRRLRELSTAAHKDSAYLQATGPSCAEVSHIDRDVPIFIDGETAPVLLAE